MTRAIVDSMTRRPLAQLLAEMPSWSLRERLMLARQLAVGVGVLHRQGRIHRSLDAATVAVDAQFMPQLNPSDGPCRFGGDRYNPELCPPELAQGPSVELPAKIEAAAVVLRQRAVPLDPRRIDVYQLGVLLCQLLTGEPFVNYLYSPTCKAEVPPMVRGMLESCLGEAGAVPLVSCEDFVAALDDLIAKLPAKQATSTSETPPLGSVVVSPGDTPPRGKAVALPSETPARKDDQVVVAGEMPARKDQKLPFERLGHFQIVEQIGAGGMGDVYRGYDASLDRYVAIKVLAPTLARDEEFVRRFVAEATAVAKLSHPNVVPIHFIGHDAGCHFFAMQFIEGQSLAQRLRREKPLPVDETVAIVEQCLAGLEAAHAQGLIHRDVKPGNILLEQGSGRAILIDFGLVRHLNSGIRMTATGVLMGTVDYVAPEQAKGKTIDGRADIYSLGVMFYELLAGHLPFVSDNPTAMIFQHAYEEPFPLEQAAPDVPQSLVDIVASMMAKKPAERYSSCAAVLADLRAFRQGDVPSASGRAGVGDGGAPGDTERLAVIASDAANDLNSTANRVAVPAAGGFVGDTDGDDLSSAAALMALPSSSPWQQARDWAATIFRRHAPQYVQGLQNTTQQMDGAVAHYQRRCKRLATLLAEARSIEIELSDQIEGRVAAAAAATASAEAASTEHARREAQAEKCEYEEDAASLRSQRDLQRQQVEELERQQSKADATLARLCSQQNALKARLQTAMACQAMEIGVPQNSRRRRLVVVSSIAATGLLLVLAVIIVVGPLDSKPSPRPLPLPVPVPAPPLVAGSPVVTEGVGWDAFRIGATLDELVEQVGSPTPNRQTRWVEWTSPQPVACLMDSARGAFEVRFNNRFGLPLASGIRVGSSENEVVSAYGAPDRRENRYPEGSHSEEMFQYSQRGVRLLIRDHAVLDFTVFKPHPPATPVTKPRLPPVVPKAVAYVAGNSPYYQAMTQMATDFGLSSGASFNTAYETYLPRSRGHILLIETHRDKPIIPEEVLERHFPGALAGLTRPSKSIRIDDTNIVFVEFSKQLEPVTAESGQRNSKRDATVIGSSQPYSNAIRKMAEDAGLRVTGVTNYKWDETFAKMQGHVFLIETHRGKPVVPVEDLEEYFPGAIAGAALPSKSIRIDDTDIVFVELSEQLQSLNMIERDEQHPLTQ